MTQPLEHRNVPRNLITSLVVAQPGLPVHADFSLVLGLNDEFPSAFANMTVVVHRLPNVFGDGGEDEVVVDDSVVLFYDPQRAGVTEHQPWELVAYSLPEEIRPQVYVCVEMDYESVSDLQAGVNLLIQHPKIVGAGAGSQWKACGRILLVEGEGRNEVLLHARERRNIVHGSQSTQSKQDDHAAGDVVPEDQG